MGRAIPFSLWGTMLLNAQQHFVSLVCLHALPVCFERPVLTHFVPFGHRQVFGI